MYAKVSRIRETRTSVSHVGFSVPPCLLTVCDGSRPQVDAIRETASNWEQLQKLSDLGLKWKVCWHSGQPVVVDQGV